MEIVDVGSLFGLTNLAFDFGTGLFPAFPRVVSEYGGDSESQALPVAGHLMISAKLGSKI